MTVVQQPVQDGRVFAQRDALLQCKDREIALREAKIDKITFELARLKRWKFGAKSETINAEQRRLFKETLAEDEASLILVERVACVGAQLQSK